MVEYKVIKSARRKRTTSIQVQDNGQVLVRAPKHVSHIQIKNFIEKNINWIENKLTELSQRPKAKRFIDGEIFLILGKEYILEIINHNKKRTTIEIENNKIKVRCFNNITNTKIKQAMEKWYKNLARTILTERVEHHIKSLSVKYNKIFIKKVKTLWGSCSRRGNLNFNYKIVMTHPDLIDYLVIHEICHLIHYNHSKKFWNLVESLDPEYRRHEKMLKEFSKNVFDR